MCGIFKSFNAALHPIIMNILFHTLTSHKHFLLSSLIYCRLFVRWNTQSIARAACTSFSLSLSPALSKWALYHKHCYKIPWTHFSSSNLNSNQNRRGNMGQWLCVYTFPKWTHKSRARSNLAHVEAKDFSCGCRWSLGAQLGTLVSAGTQTSAGAFGAASRLLGAQWAAIRVIDDNRPLSLSLSYRLSCASEKLAHRYMCARGGMKFSMGPNWDTSYTNRHMHLQRGKPKERPASKNAASPQIGLSCCEKNFPAPY